MDKFRSSPQSDEFTWSEGSVTFPSRHQRCEKAVFQAPINFNKPKRKNKKVLEISMFTKGTRLIGTRINEHISEQNEKKGIKNAKRLTNLKQGLKQDKVNVLPHIVTEDVSDINISEYSFSGDDFKRDNVYKVPKLLTMTRKSLSHCLNVSPLVNNTTVYEHTTGDRKSFICVPKHNMPDAPTEGTTSGRRQLRSNIRITTKRKSLLKRPLITNVVKEKRFTKKSLNLVKDKVRNSSLSFLSTNLGCTNSSNLRRRISKSCFDIGHSLSNILMDDISEGVTCDNEDNKISTNLLRHTLFVIDNDKEHVSKKVEMHHIKNSNVINSPIIRIEPIIDITDLKKPEEGEERDSAVLSSGVVLTEYSHNEKNLPSHSIFDLGNRKEQIDQSIDKIFESQDSSLKVRSVFSTSPIKENEYNYEESSGNTNEKNCINYDEQFHEKLSFNISSTNAGGLHCTQLGFAINKENMDTIPISTSEYLKSCLIGEKQKCFSKPSSYIDCDICLNTKRDILHETFDDSVVNVGDINSFDKDNYESLLRNESEEVKPFTINKSNVSNVHSIIFNSINDETESCERSNSSLKSSFKSGKVIEFLSDCVDFQNNKENITGELNTLGQNLTLNFNSPKLLNDKKVGSYIGNVSKFNKECYSKSSKKVVSNRKESLRSNKLNHTITVTNISEDNKITPSSTISFLKSTAKSYSLNPLDFSCLTNPNYSYTKINLTSNNKDKYKINEKDPITKDNPMNSHNISDRTSIYDETLTPHSFQSEVSSSLHETKLSNKNKGSNISTNIQKNQKDSKTLSNDNNLVRRYNLRKYDNDTLQKSVSTSEHNKCDVLSTTKLSKSHGKYSGSNSITLSNTSTSSSLNTLKVSVSTPQKVSLGFGSISQNPHIVSKSITQNRVIDSGSISLNNPINFIFTSQDSPKVVGSILLAPSIHSGSTSQKNLKNPESFSPINLKDSGSTLRNIHKGSVSLSQDLTKDSRPLSLNSGKYSEALLCTPGKDFGCLSPKNTKDYDSTSENIDKDSGSLSLNNSEKLKCIAKNVSYNDNLLMTQRIPEKTTNSLILNISDNSIIKNCKPSKKEMYNKSLHDTDPCCKTEIAHVNIMKTSKSRSNFAKKIRLSPKNPFSNSKHVCISSDELRTKSNITSSNKSVDVCNHVILKDQRSNLTDSGYNLRSKKMCVSLDTDCLHMNHFDTAMQLICDNYHSVTDLTDFESGDKSFCTTSVSNIQKSKDQIPYPKSFVSIEKEATCRNENLLNLVSVNGINISSLHETNNEIPYPESNSSSSYTSISCTNKSIINPSSSPSNLHMQSIVLPTDIIQGSGDTCIKKYKNKVVSEKFASDLMNKESAQHVKTSLPLLGKSYIESTRIMNDDRQNLLNISLSPILIKSKEERVKETFTELDEFEEEESERVEDSSLSPSCSNVQITFYDKLSKMRKNSAIEEVSEDTDIDEIEAGAPLMHISPTMEVECTILSDKCIGDSRHISKDIDINDDMDESKKVSLNDKSVEDAKQSPVDLDKFEESHDDKDRILNNETTFHEGFTTLLRDKRMNALTSSMVISNLKQNLSFINVADRKCTQKGITRNPNKRTRAQTSGIYERVVYTYCPEEKANVISHREMKVSPGTIRRRQAVLKLTKNIRVKNHKKRNSSIMRHFAKPDYMQLDKYYRSPDGVSVFFVNPKSHVKEVKKVLISEKVFKTSYLTFVEKTRHVLRPKFFSKRLLNSNSETLLEMVSDGKNFNSLLVVIDECIIYLNYLQRMIVPRDVWFLIHNPNKVKVTVTEKVAPTNPDDVF